MNGIFKFSRTHPFKTWLLPMLYFFVGILYILLPVIPVSIPPLAVKALIIPVLILIFFVTGKNEDSISHRFIFAALFFSWSGDVALGITWNPDMMFIPGLVCFLLTHALYFTVFIRTPGQNMAPRKVLYYAIPVIMYGVVLLYVLYDDLGDLKIPVILYTAVILAMLVGALSRIGKVSRTSFYLVFAGATLFLMSDSLLAINKFSLPFPLGSPLIMLTYITGQFLIVTGYLRQSNSETDKKTNK